MANNRILELDGLRGIAALWVVFYHLWGAIQKRDVTWVPSGFADFFHAGFLGVDIFFVLSGFVVTYSISNIKLTSTFIPNFIIKRSLRIDPPYWCAIILAISFMLLKSAIFPNQKTELPSIESLLAHIFYLQDILALGNISSVFWTLCIEFQFYVLFSVIYYYYSKTALSNKRLLLRLSTLASIAICGVSPYLRFSDVTLPIAGTILPYSYEFIFGVMSYHYIKGNISVVPLILSIILSSIMTVIFKPTYYAILPALTVLAIVLSGTPYTFRMLKSSLSIYLGKISYSLYLTHAIVGWVTISILSHALRQFDGKLVTILVFTAGITISIIFSVFYYHVIEKPSIKLSKKLTKNNAQDIITTSGTSP